MPYQHYIPAAYLANFSKKIEKKRRNSLVWVGDKVNKKNPIRISAVKRVCGQNDIYSPPKGMVKSLDEIWTYEAHLSEGIQRLISGDVDVELWLKVLVPFVVSLFIRSNNFDKRFRMRFNVLKFPLERIDINSARTIELQRLLCPIMTAKWIVLTVHGEDNLITNDVGFIPFENLLLDHQGFAIPLDKRHILVLVSRRKGVILREWKSSWYPLIEYMDLPKDNQISFNQMISVYANQLIVGESKELIEKYFSIEEPNMLFLEPLSLFQFSGRDLVAFEFSWYQFISFLAGYQNDRNFSDFSFSENSFKRYWDIPIMFPIDLIEFPPIFKRNNNEIEFDCYDPSQYFVYSSLNSLMHMKKYKELIKAYKHDIKEISDHKLKERAYFLRQSALSELGRLSQVLHELKKNWQENSEYYYFRGTCYLQLKEFDKALKDFHKSCSLSDDNDKALSNLAACFLFQGRDEIAQAIFSCLTSSTEKHIVAISHLNLGLIKVRQNDHESAIVEFSLVDSSQLEDEERTFLFSNQIESMFENKQYAKIPIIIEEFQKLVPSDYRIDHYKTWLDDLTENKEAYINDSNLLLKRKIKSELRASIHSKRSVVYFEEREIDNAFKEIKAAIKCDFLNVKYHSDLAELRLFDGNFLGALPEAFLALMFSKFDGRAFNTIGVVLSSNGFQNLAFFFFKIAIRKLEGNEEIIRPYRNLLHCLLGKRILENTEILKEKIIELAPDAYETKIVISRYYLVHSDYKSAIAMLSSLSNEETSEKEVKLIKLLIEFKFGHEMNDKKLIQFIKNGKVPRITVNRYRREFQELGVHI